MPAPVAYPQSRARIAEICDRAGDAVELRQRVLAEIRRVVGCDAHVWLLTDPETSVGAAPLADIPAALVPRLPDLIRLKYLTDVNRWTTLAPPVASLCAATDGELARSRLWRDLLGRYGVVDVASCVFGDRFGCWGFLDLWRTGGGRFAEPELGYLTALVEPVAGALRRCQAATFTATAPRPARPPGPVVLLLSPELRVIGQTPQTHEYLRTLVPPSAGREPIPASAYNVGAQLLALEAGIDANPPAARVHLADGRWLSLSAARIGDAGEENERSIAVTIEEATPQARAALFGRAYGLSPRERDVLAQLLTGADTRAVARQLYLSEHTVQDHLKSIFAKTATRSRAALLSRALGT